MFARKAVWLHVSCNAIHPGVIIDLFGQLNVVPNSNLPGISFFAYCICIIMWHSYLNDMEIPETKRFIPKGFELGTTLG